MKNLKLTIEKSYLNIGDYLINDIGNEISTLTPGDKITIISPYISKIPITNSIAKYSNLSETDDLVLELLKKEIQIEMISSYKNDIFIIDFSEAIFVNQNITLKKYISINTVFSSKKKYSIVENPDIEIDIYSLTVLIKYLFKNEVNIFENFLEKEICLTNWYKCMYEFMGNIRGSIEYI